MFTSERIASFNELDMAIYHYVSQNRDKVAYMRIRELAEETHVSTTTILRFCKRLAVTDFLNLKQSLNLIKRKNSSQLKVDIIL